MENFKINDQEATVENLIEAGYRRYRGEEMDIYYNANICEHVGECVRGNPAVWEVGRKPWILPDNGEKLDNQRIINRCPSGALKYIK
ncbi:(4Fe-4S)-binding protein [Lactococcus ileimucosae]|uniref:(4Fe-4S)-binding protein n=1 Tax=Lactococcus ileimucosae TaxID=2941329 RepID=UPI002042FADE|nr:(4Fe-4S)-binding protein [Lactococcus ileimucosae]